MPHHPGFGASADDPSIDERQDYHLHYLDLFDRLGLGEVALVGHSLGGRWQQPRCVRSAYAVVLAARPGLNVPEHPTTDIFSVPPEQIVGYLFADLSLPRARHSAARVRRGAE